MRLDGKVNKIERLVGRFGKAGEVEDEKRVFHLTVRLPDMSMREAYAYGYGQMHFILHGKAMEDFVDLGGQVDIYVVAKDGGEVPEREWENLRTENYRLEGEVKSLASTNATFKQRADDKDKEVRALHQRLSVAMDEVMRLEARLGQMPPAPLQLENGDEA
jgi:hypothetical protein